MISTQVDLANMCSEVSSTRLELVSRDVMHFLRTSHQNLQTSISNVRTEGMKKT